MFSSRSVCLSVCPSDNWKSCERILTKFLGGVGHSPGPMSSILVTIQITVRIQESEVRNPHSLDYRKSYQRMKYYRELGCGLETNWLHFCVDPQIQSLYCPNPSLAISAPSFIAFCNYCSHCCWAWYCRMSAMFPRSQLTQRHPLINVDLQWTPPALWLLDNIRPLLSVRHLFWLFNRSIDCVTLYVVFSGCIRTIYIVGMKSAWHATPCVTSHVQNKPSFSFTID